MTTRAQLKALARAELGDTSATPLWPEERLNAWVAEAVREYGQALPRSASVDLVSVAAQAAYALPADLLAITGVEHPSGSHRALGHRSENGALVYSLSASQLVLDPAPAATGETIRARYAARYAEPAADGDTLATPPVDDDLLVLAVATRALAWLATAELKTLRQSSRTSPPGAGGHAADYAARLQAALKARRRALRPTRLSALGP